MPSDLSCRTNSDRSERVNSGGVVGSRVDSIEDGKRRKHFPGDVRPALPERWEREAMEQGVVTSASIPVIGLNERSLIQVSWKLSAVHCNFIQAGGFTLTKPESTTYLIPSIVIEASATFVLMTTFLVRGGGGSKAIICCSVDRPE